MDGHVNDLPASGTDVSATADESISLFDLLVPLARHIRLLTIGPLAVGVLAFGIASFLRPTFTATTSFLPPQQSQSSVAASAMASLSSLGALAGSAGALRTPADQYVAFLQSVTVSDRIIDHFNLMQVYGKELRVDARTALSHLVRASVGKKDGLITVEVDDATPGRAADIANRYVEELRRMTGTIAVTEAQQRRLFFEQQLAQTQKKLVQAQQAMQSSGVSEGALKAEPRAAAEGYARLKAELTAAEVRLQTLRGNLADPTSEVQQQLAVVAALRSQLGKLEQNTDVQRGPDYITKYREFKYQETLFELYARQYELARVDESREGSLIQVVDPATPPERKSKPKRSIVALVATLLTALALTTTVLVRHAWRRSAADPAKAEQIARLRAALARR